MLGSQAVLLSPLIGGAGPKSLVLRLDDLDGSAPQREFEPTIPMYIGIAAGLHEDASSRNMSCLSPLSSSMVQTIEQKRSSTCSKEHFNNTSFAFKNNRKESCFASWHQCHPSASWRWRRQTGWDAQTI